ncbi:MAG: acetyl-CoA/propionyl-CoA carboxylase, biotin carboxylase, biotin carboxyl carrier protein [Actinomycetota bacterium]|nr:acetyl-CoA/propionyl-CoA carboxylase, biotin carboxylase, biotin carboxyl carrier protein [Actinomycetota bacterium]
MAPPFTTVLVANRGEIAVRVIRACRELGIATVAVHSDADAGSLPVRLADRAVALPGRTAAETYLDRDRLVAAVRGSGADAVHPGYGFLAEDAAFARAVAAAGAVFIGPPPVAIEMMGDKLSARLAAETAGVAVVPGTTGALTDATEVVRFGDVHGWPVAIKAAFGGGGRGIRVVASAAEANDAFASAASEAEQGFGHGECYIERYLAWPRHVEMQIFADAHGACVWLGERDCSIQRRHQKLIEEAPAPALPDDVRRAMGEAAVRVAKVAGYVGAGTVEFLYEAKDGQDGQFWFLEMNTRLQVEHPVTEMVTGLDLVAEQIRVAAGAPLSFTQEGAQRRGHAIECRVNAEDPAGGRFVPAPGTPTALVPPQGPGVRWDGGYEAGDTVPPFYDNLVGKLVVWATDRPAAIARMEAALAELRLEGLPTTVPAQRAILAHPDFVAVRHSTVWVEQCLTLPDATPGVEPDGGGRSQEVRVGGRWYVIPRPGETTRPAAGRGLGPSAGEGRRASGTVASQMQGTVGRVLVAVGDAVEAGQGVCAVEAMKMETLLRTEIGGTVAEVRVMAGQAVRAGEVLVVVEPVGDTVAASPGAAEEPA